jgi:hypothetical protein
MIDSYPLVVDENVSVIDSDIFSAINICCKRYYFFSTEALILDGSNLNKIASLKISRLSANRHGDHIVCISMGFLCRSKEYDLWLN